MEHLAGERIFTRSASLSLMCWWTAVLQQDLQSKHLHRAYVKQTHWRDAKFRARDHVGFCVPCEPHYVQVDIVRVGQQVVASGMHGIRDDTQ